MSKRKACGALDRWVKPRVPVQPEDDWLAGLASGPGDLADWPKGTAEAHRTGEGVLHGFIVPVVSESQYVAAKKRAKDLSWKSKDSFGIRPFDWECDRRSRRVLVYCKHCREDAGSTWGGFYDEAREKVATERSYAWEVRVETAAHKHIAEYLNSNCRRLLP